MKNCVFILLLIPFVVNGQVSSHKYYRADSTVYTELIQLDSIDGVHQQIVDYHENGQKAREFFAKHRIIYGTLNQWSKDGVITHQEFYTDTGYREVSYHNNGQISSIGYWVRVSQRSKEMTIRDSSTFDEYNTAKCKFTCYERADIWKTYYTNGTLKSEGRYLPMQFIVFHQSAIDSNGISYTIPKSSFDLPAGISNGWGKFFPEGKWTYYLESGEIKEEITYTNGFPNKNGL
jgi:antitoxin component YwqK of YwqJK toxin-antitoxin module